MGTAIRVELHCADPEAGADAADAVMAEMHRIDRTMSPHRADSELSRINREAALQWVPLSDEMHALLARAQQFARWSHGAFDLTYASAGALYDYRECIAPDEPALAVARAAIGWQQLKLDPITRSVHFARPGMRIDLGGFAKGHAVDRSIALLRARGIRHAMVSAGGDSHVIGERGGRPWTVAIRDPRREGEVVAVLPLADCAVSTSGDYERYFERDGVRHHHLIDPRTGRSPDGVRSVTILADDGLSSEAWSKTVFVLGVERGLALINQQPGVDAIVIDRDGRLHTSAGLLNQGALS